MSCTRWSDYQATPLHDGDSIPSRLTPCNRDSGFSCVEVAILPQQALSCTWSLSMAHPRQRLTASRHEQPTVADLLSLGPKIRQVFKCYYNE